MAVSLAFVIAGIVDLFVGTPDPRLLLIGAAGWTVTIVRCIQFALWSDLRAAAHRAMGPRQSRLVLGPDRLAAHHPSAGAAARAAPGLSSLPHSAAPEHVTRRPWKVPLPDLADFGRAARLAFGGVERRAYWSEQWVSIEGLLSELIGVMRAARPAPVVEVDEGWHPDRDVSVAVGRWAWRTRGGWWRSTRRAAVSSASVSSFVPA
ncbi:MAG: hypothetical protein R2712_13020 [Vicinamibacterales bacterium]